MSCQISETLGCQSSQKILFILKEIVALLNYQINNFQLHFQNFHILFVIFFSESVTIFKMVNVI